MTDVVCPVVIIDAFGGHTMASLKRRFVIGNFVLETGDDIHLRGRLSKQLAIPSESANATL